MAFNIIRKTIFNMHAKGIMTFKLIGSSPVHHPLPAGLPKKFTSAFIHITKMALNVYAKEIAFKIDRNGFQID